MKKRLNKLMTLVVMAMLMAMGIPMALSADTNLPHKEGGLQSFPVEAATQIYKGAMVCLNTSGYLVAAADTQGYRFAGIAYENVLGTTQGALSCRVHTDGVFKLTAEATITQAMVGRMMSVVDDGTVAEDAGDIVVGRMVEYVSGTLCWVDIGQRFESIGYQDHLSLSTDLATKTIRLNNKTCTTNASIIGVQTKPRAGVIQTNDVIGMESMPGLGVTAITNSAGIVCYKAEPYIHATAGAIAGDVRGYEVSLGCPAGAGAIGGTMSGVKFINNTAKAVTGGIYCLHVLTHGDAQPWAGFAKFPDDNVIANDGDSKAGGTVGWIKVMIGAKTGYIQVETLA